MRTGIARVITAAAVACLAVTAAACGQDTASVTEVAGTPRSDFYSPPAESIPGPHGSVIRTQPVTGSQAVPGARNFLVLYRSVDAQGKPVAVSGTLAVPEGTPPAGGWPLLSWAPGTNGVADVCAPSRAEGSSPGKDEQARWVAKGYAVARTDYQGLGTPGDHGYLIGETEQRAMSDIATAAREVDKTVGARWVAMGHSQGGHAALFAASAAGAWAPGAPLLGAVALAPASHLGEQVRMAKWAVSNPLGKLGTGDISLYVPLLVRGAQTVTDVDPGRFLTGRAVSLLPLADSECTAGLRDRSRWGGLSAKDVFTEDGDPSGLLRVLDDNDPSGLRFAAPVLVLQGRSDLTVPLKSTDAMVAEQQLNGQSVDYRKYDDVDHSGIVAAGFADALGWVDTRFGITR
ncbi:MULTISPECIES: alpha/beta hydrolase family protein [Nocardia]|uniref:alpha/beta hydrolase family protein n=1 Tax=Nocardia TaxID=1817 RepID=UPI00292FD5B1|nr:lipase family protein [Nocardia canadensis]